MGKPLLLACKSLQGELTQVIEATKFDGLRPAVIKK